jgi:hypothetical protein
MKMANKTAKTYMKTIPVMIESSTNMRNNKTIRQKNIIPNDKEVENILYVKDIITPSSLSTSSSSIPDSDSVNIVFSKIIE